MTTYYVLYVILVLNNLENMEAFRSTKFSLLDSKTIAYSVHYRITKSKHFIYFTYCCLSPLFCGYLEIISLVNVNYEITPCCVFPKEMTFIFIVTIERLLTKYV